MRRRISAALCILTMLLLAFDCAETEWVCINCGKHVRAVLGDICPYCGAEKHEHTWLDATCDTPRTCSGCGETEGAPLGHAWQEATCTQPKTCTRCGLTEGAAIGHAWQEATCTQPKTCSRCGSTEGAPLGHSWQEGTCTQQKTCGRCGKTEGSALGHAWQEATCTKPKTCSRCGSTEGTALGHAWQEATCTQPKTCSRCGSTEGAALGHTWQEATCTQPKTCSRCGSTEGAALGHAWQEAACTQPKTCSRCGAIGGTALGHAWKEATCTQPKTCSRCGVTEGAALGHTWQEATCTQPKTCGLCGVTEGAALGHAWKTATCTQPKTCSRCGATEGAALGHTWLDATFTTPKTCIRCGATEGDKLFPGYRIVTFGRYPQTASGTDETPIEWIVLNEQKDKVLLVSRYCLDAKPYNKKDKDVTWETCTLRAWLNEEFLKKAFTKEERKSILLTNVDNSDEQGWAFKYYHSPDDATCGNDTQDKIFLLSLAEADRYSLVTLDDGDGAEQTRVAPTEYAKAASIWIDEDHKTLDGQAAVNWWLRSTGVLQNEAIIGSRDGGTSNADVYYDDFGVRPALWLDRASGTF